MKLVIFLLFTALLTLGYQNCAPYERAGESDSFSSDLPGNMNNDLTKSIEAGGLGQAFGDGLLCASGPTIRLAARIASDGSASFGFGVAGDPLVSVRGAVPAPGETRYYQVWYRDVQDPFFVGLSNGLAVDFCD